MLVEARVKNAATAKQMIGDLPMLTIDRVSANADVSLQAHSIAHCMRCCKATCQITVR